MLKIDALVDAGMVSLMVMGGVICYAVPVFWKRILRRHLIHEIKTLNQGLQLSSKGMSQLIDPENPYMVFADENGELDFSFLWLGNLRQLRRELRLIKEQKARV
ncbi:hypothetical protein [Lacticaseibacillus paracasei]|uniref:hypothetical protein n=1 Tax=Lacticaseibacillus paracasei TaxID=1597 RepID=UPI00073C1C6F|nr:hypothetical protein [Lacticaseibacillus paracasei]KTE97424.1 hypothetical protein AC564_2845c [Lacticaseibacillus paracasei]